jgi:hypothetical protein
MFVVNRVAMAYTHVFIIIIIINLKVI